MTKPLTEKYKLYREAARRIAEEEECFTCYAVRRTVQPDRDLSCNIVDAGLYLVPEVAAYVDTMKSEVNQRHHYTAATEMLYALNVEIDRQNVRTMLLLFMAETCR